MFLQEVLAELEGKFNIKMAQSTLRNYQNDGLISPAKRTSLGRWKGTVTEYPDDIIPEVYAAYMLQNGAITTKPDMIKAARKLIYAVENQLPEAARPEGLSRMLEMVCIIWLYYRELALTGKETAAEITVDKKGNVGVAFLDLETKERYSY